MFAGISHGRHVVIIDSRKLCMLGDSALCDFVANGIEVFILG
jgi:hypothetical protein